MSDASHPHGGQPVASLGAPLGHGRGVVICVHGRNAEPRNILELADVLAFPDLTYLAPAAAGRTWYPLSFLAPREQNEPFLASALRALDELVERVIAAGVPRERIVLLGFSQGACLACEYAWQHPARYGGLVAFSGGLVGPPGTAWDSSGRPGLDGLPVFLGCSDVDSHVPKTRVDETAVVFGMMGAQVTERIYPGMGHLVSDDEITQARVVITRALG
jgi:phospholipase/carboxylesterase